MQEKKVGVDFDLQERAEKLAKQGNWKQAMELFSRCVDQHTAELALIKSVQEGLSSKLEMQGIYDLVGSFVNHTYKKQGEPRNKPARNLSHCYHHYAIEN